MALVLILKLTLHLMIYNFLNHFFFSVDYVTFHSILHLHLFTYKYEIKLIFWWYTLILLVVVIFSKIIEDVFVIYEWSRTYCHSKSMLTYLFKASQIFLIIVKLILSHLFVSTVIFLSV